jgi:hypothetical protein
MNMVFVGVLASSLLVLDCEQAFSDTMREIECHPISVMVQENNDRKTRQTISGPDIESYLAETAPKGCEFSIFRYGNGILDLQDAPSKCSKAAGLTDAVWKQVYPIKYKISGAEIRFKRSISTSLSEIGKVTLAISGHYNIDDMIMYSRAEVKSIETSNVLLLEFGFQCF